MASNDYMVKSFDDAELSLRIFGSGRKPVIVFLHGMGGDQEAWGGTLQELQKLGVTKNYSLVTYDLRGHGRSTRVLPTDEDLFQTNAKDLSVVIQFLLKEQKMTSVTIAGHCFGSFVAQRFLSEFSVPEVQQAILLSGPSRSRGLQLPNWGARLLLFLPNFPLIARSWSDHERFIGSEDFSFTRIYSDLRNCGFGTYLAMEWMMSGRRVTRKGKSISIPIWVGAGEDDTFFPMSTMRKFQEAIHAKEFFIFPKSNHILPINTSDSLARFIASVL